jgi:hypothetical protein
MFGGEDLDNNFFWTDAVEIPVVPVATADNAMRQEQDENPRAMPQAGSDFGCIGRMAGRTPTGMRYPRSARILAANVVRPPPMQSADHGAVRQ